MALQAQIILLICISNKNTDNNWPDDADGDVFRRLKDHDFDFSVENVIDFNVDTENWPLEEEVISLLSEKYGEIIVYEPEGDSDGYLQFRIKDYLSYDLVMKVQNDVTELLEPFDACCESWSVMQH